MNANSTKYVSKAVIIDNDNKYLLLTRSDHPVFGADADLPGGTAELDETPLDTLIREVEEEVRVTLNPKEVTEIYRGDEYAGPGITYVLYVARVETRPEVTISWEHQKYEWINQAAFLDRAQTAVDRYMHMTYAAIFRNI